MDYFDSDVVDRPGYLEDFVKRFNAPLIDRSGVMNSEHLILTKIPEELDYSTPDFFDVTDIRAKKILSRAEREDKNIRISYSGGIDSVCVLVAFLKHKHHYPDVEIEVVLSADSVKEYPKFFNEHIKDKLKTLRADGNLLYRVIPEDHGKPFLLVTGELGDQLFGSALMFKGDYQTQLENKWDETFTPMFVEYWKPLIDLMPEREHISAAEVFWWLNFVLKYQWVQLRMYVLIDAKVHHDDIVHFFGGRAYQNWSMITPMSVKFPDLSDPTTYKLPAKQYIYDFTGDEEYYKTKRKHGSLKDNLKNPIRKRLERITRRLELVEKYETGKAFGQ